MSAAPKATRRTARPTAQIKHVVKGVVTENPTPFVSSEVETPQASPPQGIITLPLFALVLSALNVRQTERDADVAALAEDIAARGLKQNLVVTPAHFSTADCADGWATRYEVIAGGRRYQALALLAADGRLPHDHPVPCLLEARGEARETSLSENLHRVAMNPADEFEAFAAIVAAQRGGSEAIALCAKRFGVSARHVEGRLRLAALAPHLLAALRQGTIGVDSAKAYAITADHAAQAKEFEAQCKASYKPHDPRTIRDALRGRSLGLDDRLVRFIGIDAYREAGGRTEHEMFMGAEGGERLLDLALVEQLAQARGDALLPAEVAAQGWASALFTLNSWQIKAPEGFKRSWEHDPATIPADDRAGQIGLYAISEDADGLDFVESFEPLPRQDEADGEVAAPLRPSWTPPTPEERAALQREKDILLWSARLALGSFEGSPLKGRAFWPHGHVPAIETEWASTDPDDETVAAYLVAVTVRVDAADLPAFRAAAEARADQIAAERTAAIEAARAAREAEAEADDDDDDDAGDDEGDED